MVESKRLHLLGLRAEALEGRGELLRARVLLLRQPGRPARALRQHLAAAAVHEVPRDHEELQPKLAQRGHARQLRGVLEQQQLEPVRAGERATGHGPPDPRCRRARARVTTGRF